MAGIKDIEWKACKHKWKVIRAEEGKEETLFTRFTGLGLLGRDVIIYHLLCENCGEIKVRHANICLRNAEYRILKEVKWREH